MSKADTISQHLTRWKRAMDARVQWTREAWLDLRFEAGKTWSQEEMAIFRDQNRDPSNYNLIRPTIALIAGIEAQNRSDMRVLPRVSAHAQSADALTKLVKYVQDQNRTPRQLSWAFQWGIKTGIGWLEVGYNTDPVEERIMTRAQNPFEIWLDPACREPDLSDALDIFRAKWVYPDHLALLFPKMKDQFPRTGPSDFDPLSHTADWTNDHGDRPPVALFNGGYGGDSGYGPGHGILYGFGYGGFTQDTEILAPIDRYRDLVLAIERWYRVEEIALFARFKSGLVLENTPENQPAIARALLAGEAQLVRALTHRVRCAIFTEHGQLLQDIESPYSHHRFPFVPLWTYQDENGVPMGIVRGFRDAQKEYNARRTHLTKRAIQNQWVYEADAFVDEDEAISELRQHDGTIRVRPQGLDKIRRLEDTATSQIDAEMLGGAQKYIQDFSGATMELLGQQTNATSGVAIQSRQQQGRTNLFTLFDNRDLSQMQMGEMVMSLIQDSYTDEMEVRITGDSRAPQFISINYQDPNSGERVNDITQGRFDLIMTQAPMSPSDRAAQAATISQFLANMPPNMKMMFAGEIADLNDLPPDFVEQVRQFAQQMMNQAPPTKPPQELINYKDAPDDIRRQMEHQAGMQPSQIPPGAPGNQRDVKQPPGVGPNVSPPPQAPPPPAGPSAMPPPHP